MRGMRMAAAGCALILGLLLALDSVAISSPQGDLRVVLTGLQDESIDPHRVVGGLQRPILFALADSLYMVGIDGKLSPALATSFKITQDGLGWTFTLREGVKYHNGGLMNAQDVMFSIERTARPEMKTAWGAELYRLIDRIEVIDPCTLTVYTKTPCSIFLDRLAAIAPAPRAYIEEAGEGVFKQHPVSAGPFKFVKRAIGEFIEFQAFEEHWRKVPSIRNLQLRIVAEASTRLAMLKTGEADVMAGLAGAMVQEVKADKTLKTVSSPMTATQHIVFTDLVSTEPSPFKDLRVRKALYHAIDRTAIGAGSRAAPIWLQARQSW